jgi:hypothetical protein
MKKILIALMLGAVLAPAFVSADAFGIEPTRGQLLSRIAALQAILTNKTINCALAATKSVVKVGEPVVISWGSFGADAKYSNDPSNAYTENGEQAIVLDSPQTRTYQFTFFGPNSGKVTCEYTITATR